MLARARRSSGSPSRSTRSRSATGGPQSATIGGVNDVQRIFGGIAQDGAYLGPEDAEITITVFNDIQCAPCADFEIETIDPLVERYARTDEARIEFRHFSLAPNDTTLAAIAAEAAGVQERQWQYLDTFVRNHRRGAARGRSTRSSCARSPRRCPELDPTSGRRTSTTPRPTELVREDAMLAAELEAARRAGGRRHRPRGRAHADRDAEPRAEIEAAIAQVSGPG